MISIHAPLTGSDDGKYDSQTQGHQISIHAPLTGSDIRPLNITIMKNISIHAPLTGSDQASTETKTKIQNFNPRSPYGERPILK